MNKHILIVEDETMISDIIQRYLSNYIVSIVRTGKELYSLLSGSSTNLYSLVISDINLPYYSGDEAVEMANCFSFKAPVLYISGKLPPENLKVENFLMKPFSKEEFLKKVNELLDKSDV